MLSGLLPLTHTAVAMTPVSAETSADTSSAGLLVWGVSIIHSRSHTSVCLSCTPYLTASPLTHQTGPILGLQKDTRRIQSWLASLMSVCSVAQLCPALCNTHELWHTRLLCPWNFPGKNIGVSCHFLLQGIFLTQGLNSSLTLQADFLPSEPPGKPKHT